MRKSTENLSRERKFLIMNITIHLLINIAKFLQVAKFMYKIYASKSEPPTFEVGKIKYL